MSKEDCDLVTVGKCVNEKSLLERYDIPIEHLSYEYITECTRVKELEQIVVILRSGQEGFFPDLTKHAEERLAEVKPQSAILRVAEPVVTKDMLAPENRNKIENDMNEWMSVMKLREKDLEEGRLILTNDTNSQPDVRQIKFIEPKKKQQSHHSREKSKRIGACDYAGWDKYDADTEINRIDLQLEKKQVEAMRNQQKVREKEEKMKSSSREAMVNKLTLTGTELSVMAEREREKGNEAFKAGDYREALELYNSSIAIDATINAYNNRAITHVKLQRYDDAVNDCNWVIGIDERNVKALLRRGLAFEHLEKRAQALADYETVLKVEPTNKVAITALNRLRRPCESKKIRMKIEVEDEKETVHKGQESKGNDMGGGRNFSNRSISVESTLPIIRPEVCFCNNAPSSSQHSSPLPHVKGAYCSKTNREFTKFPKSQSLYDVGKSFDKKSSVVIEELPNDWSGKSDKMLERKLVENEPQNDVAKIKTSNFANGDDENISNKSANNKTSNFANVADENISNEFVNNKTSNFANGNDEKISNKFHNTARVTNQANPATVKADNPKVELTNSQKFDRIESPYEFLKLWHSLKNDPDLILHSRLLKALAPDMIDSVIGNKLDGDMLSMILRSIERHWSASEDATLFCDFLQCLAKVKRFSIARMLMSASDKKVLERIFSALEADGSTDRIQDLRKSYDFPM